MGFRRQTDRPSSTKLARSVADLAPFTAPCLVSVSHRPRSPLGQTLASNNSLRLWARITTCGAISKTWACRCPTATILTCAGSCRSRGTPFLVGASSALIEIFTCHFSANWHLILLNGSTRCANARVYWMRSPPSWPFVQVCYEQAPEKKCVLAKLKVQIVRSRSIGYDIET